MIFATLRALLCVFLLVSVLNPLARAADLLGANWDTGTLYRISSDNAVLTPVAGSVGLIGAMEMASDGWIYAISLLDSGIYRIHPQTFVTIPHAQLTSISMFEGGLAFSPGGPAYLVNGDNAANPELHILDINTGVSNLIGTISGGDHDINGLAWRSDGVLVGLDRVTNSLLAINPTTALSSVIASLSPTVGSVGGMTVVEGVGYFNTSGPGGVGSNELWRFDLFTGAHARIGSLAPTISGTGISGLTMIPEPGAAGALLAAMLVLSKRRLDPIAK